mgnify:CR=1 FL=1
MKREKMAYRLKKELDAARYAHTLGVEKTAREMAEKFGVDEEKAALACTASQPFIDVPDWCAPYVAYAYERGYSNGVGTDSLGHSYFGTQQTASAAMYVEFMLRALGYSSTATTNSSDALDRAVTAGVLTAGERTARQCSDFVRTSGGAALSRKLIDAGVFTDADYRAAQAMVTTGRLA